MSTTNDGASDGVPATFAAGCFWGTEYFFKRQFKTSLLSCRVGYMGGSTIDPKYPDVKKGHTGHAEVLHLRYDPEKVNYEQLLAFFFRMHNPTELNHQGHDVGTQYRSAIFFHDETQKAAAEAYLSRLETDATLKEKWVTAFGGDRSIVTRLEPATTFFDAEDYHQQYLDVNPDGECNHRIYYNL